MDAAELQVSAEDIGAMMAKTFQGWHVSNMGAAGRTLFAYVPINCSTGSAIASEIQSSNAVHANAASNNPAEQEAFAMQGGGTNYRPFTVRVRGGSDYCAATECDVAEYYKPTAEYEAAKSAVVEGCNSVIADSKFGFRQPSSDGIAVNGVADLSKVWNNMGMLEVYRTAIDLAKKRLSSADAAWRDPRSRVAVDNQLRECIMRLVFA